MYTMRGRIWKTQADRDAGRPPIVDERLTQKCGTMPTPSPSQYPTGYYPTSTPKPSGSYPTPTLAPSYYPTPTRSPSGYPMPTNIPTSNLPNLTIIPGAIIVGSPRVVNQPVPVYFTMINNGKSTASPSHYQYTGQSDGFSTTSSQNTCVSSTNLAPGQTCVKRK